VRVLVSLQGEVQCSAAGLSSGPAVPWRVGAARQPVDSADPFLFHKTTRRAVYEGARAARLDCDDTLLWNERGEVTESTVANVVVEQDGELITPPLDCGLLPGVLRAELLAHGVIRERVIALADLKPGQRLWLINSVRGWIEAIYEPELAAPALQ
jgi:para-aminobenzoate synthetase/4-amino-4-deoxychorismate lyase